MSDEQNMPDVIRIKTSHITHGVSITGVCNDDDPEGTLYLRIPENLDHGEGLAVVTREWLDWNSESDKERAKEYHTTIATLTAERDEAKWRYDGLTQHHDDALDAWRQADATIANLTAENERLIQRVSDMEVIIHTAAAPAMAMLKELRESAQLKETTDE